MTSEVVIDVQQKDISIALMEDKQLVEYQNEPREASFSVGNIYIAKVKKLMPGLNACFVDVGYERDAFLHYLDLGSHFNSYQKYLKQVQSDRKKLFPFSKASKMPELEKDGRNDCGNYNDRDEYIGTSDSEYGEKGIDPWHQRRCDRVCTGSIVPLWNRNGQSDCLGET